MMPVMPTVRAEPTNPVHSVLHHHQEAEGGTVGVHVPCCVFAVIIIVGVFQVIRQLIGRKQAEIRQERPGLACFSKEVTQIPIREIPGVCKW